MRKFKTILLVDDEESTIFINKRLLIKANITENILVARNGKEALDTILDPNIKKPELVFLDINMPVMDGWEFLEEYESTISSEIKSQINIVIMVTTSLNPEDEKKAKKYSIVKSFLRKPLTMESLKMALNLPDLSEEYNNKKYKFVKVFNLPSNFNEIFNSRLEIFTYTINQRKWLDDLSKKEQEFCTWLMNNGAKLNEELIIKK